jgi:hypothetical protein
MPSCDDEPPRYEEGCEVCNEAVDNCVCPECPVCGVIGRLACYGEHIPVTRTIRNEADLLAYLEADSRELAAKHVYKYTDCGAWITFEADGIKLGSIVEGADFGTAIYPLKYPFATEDYGARIKAIEEEADQIWKWANERPEEEEDLECPCYSNDFETDGRSA